MVRVSRERSWPLVGGESTSGDVKYQVIRMMKENSRVEAWSSHLPTGRSGLLVPGEIQYIIADNFFFLLPWCYVTSC